MPDTAPVLTRDQGRGRPGPSLGLHGGGLWLNCSPASWPLELSPWAVTFSSRSPEAAQWDCDGSQEVWGALWQEGLTSPAPQSRPQHPEASGPRSPWQLTVCLCYVVLSGRTAETLGIGSTHTHPQCPALVEKWPQLGPREDGHTGPGWTGVWSGHLSLYEPHCALRWQSQALYPQPGRHAPSSSLCRPMGKGDRKLGAERPFDHCQHRAAGVLWGEAQYG